jgi:porphobilinogen synthase
MLMVKPAWGYGDLIWQIKQETRLPIAVYNVSGEYAMLKLASEGGFLDERAAVYELMTSLRRAGADIVISYHSKDLARWLSQTA